MQELEQIGATVQSLASIGRGCPDLLVGYRGINFLLEIKDGKKSPSRRRLTGDQVDWHAAWRGRLYVVESAIQALEIVCGKN